MYNTMDSRPKPAAFLLHFCACIGNARTAVVLAALITASALFPVTARAAEPMMRGKLTVYSRAEGEKLEKIATDILSETFAREGRIRTVLADDLKKLPDYIWLRKNLSSYTFTSGLYCESDGEGMTVTDLAAGRERLSAAARETEEVKCWVREHVRGKQATLETVRELYAEIALNASYRQEGASVLNLIRNHTGICGDFAKLFNAELEALGIESCIVVGHVDGRQDLHAWNSFALDGKIYTCDLSAAVTQKIQTDFFSFFVEDPTMMLQDGRHVIDGVW